MSLISINEDIASGVSSSPRLTVEQERPSDATNDVQQSYTENPGSSSVSAQDDFITNHRPNSGSDCGVGNGILSNDSQVEPSNHGDYSNLFIPAPSLASSRYNRQLLIPSISISGHGRIASSRILIVGLGGLGSPAALYLAAAGVGTLGLMDDDKVELSNLHRQIVHCEASVQEGLGKVESAVRACQALNSEISLVGHEVRCDVADGRGEELFKIMDGYDVVLDCTDNPATRYLISDICVLLGKVLVSGAAQRLEGQLCLLNYPLTSQLQSDSDKSAPNNDRGPCYRCVFPTPPSPEMVKGCGEIGILGPVVGTIGTLMASEALRFVVKGIEEARKPIMLLYNAWSIDPRGMFRSITLRGRRKDCLACGTDDTLSEKGKRKITREDVTQGRWNYASFCGIVEDVKVLNADERVQATKFLDMFSKARAANSNGGHLTWKNPIVIDVREAHEIEMGPKIDGSINVPFSKILRKDGAVAEMDAMLHNEDTDAMVFVCQQGNDSQIAARKLLDFQNDQSDNQDTSVATKRDTTIFIGDIVRGFVGIQQAFG